MSIAACLTKLVEEGKLDAERAQRWREEYDRLRKSYGKTMGQVAAAEAASKDMVDAIEWRNINNRRQTLLQIKTQQNILGRLQSHLEKGGSATSVAVSIMEHHEAGDRGPSVENVRGALYRLAWSRMQGFLGRYERDLLGRVRHGDELREMVRALRGEHTDNASAREMAKAVGDTFEWLRQMFNNAGGNIAKLADWGLPQRHDALGIGKAGFTAWWDFIRPLLNPEKMMDGATGKAFATEDAVREAGEYAWRAIVSHGMDGQVPGTVSGPGKMANSRADHRFFVFKDADAWLKYNDRFGSSDPFDAVIGHIDSMTRDIAAMQVLGPNPAQTVRWIGDILKQDALPTIEGGKVIKLEKDAGKAAKEVADMWDYYTGTLTAVAPENRTYARRWSALRNWNVATKLGSAFIDAIVTDPTYAGVTAKMNGLPVMRVLSEYVKGFQPFNKGHREIAEHAGLVFSEMTSRAERMYREGQGFNFHELSRRFADGAMRTSLLSPHTVAMKQAVGLGFMRDWADHAGRAFDKLEAPKRKSLERYGITAADWDRLRAIPIVEDGGKKLLRPGDLARDGGDEGLASAIKFMSLIDSELRFAVPSEQLRAQTKVATLNNSVRIERGTLAGEMLHSASQFKTFSAIAMFTHIQRALYGTEGGMSRVAYALTLPTLLILGGYLSNSMREIRDGKDPSPWFTLAGFGRAVVRSGAFGYLADIGANGLDDRHGGPIASFVTGPTIGSVIDPLFSMVGGNIRKAEEDKDTNLQAEGYRWLRQALPGNNIWYARLALNRLWLDQLQTQFDPYYARSWARMDRAAREAGTEFWMAPGQTTPDRAPNLGNAMAAPPQP